MTLKKEAAEKLQETTYTQKEGGDKNADMSGIMDNY